MKARAAFLFLLGLGLGGASSASAQQTNPHPCQFNSDVPCMILKIFNDETNKWLFPVVTVGPKDKADGDVWMQAWFKIKNKDLLANTFRTTKSYRFWIEPTHGIAPKTGVSITIPLYTQIEQFPQPSLTNQYIEWWQGGRVEVYSSDTAAPPKEYTEQFQNLFNPKTNRKPNNQEPFRAWGGRNGGGARDGLPICSGCAELLSFYSDTADLPAWNPYQLFEFTLGARVDTFKTGPDDQRNQLDTGNLDFDMSYVNIAHFGATLGPVENNQVGFVGTPQPIAEFVKSVRQFLADYHTDGPGGDWPRYIDPDAQVKGNPVTPTEPPKVASPLEVFLRLAGTATLPPPDLFPKPPNWPTVLWKPIEDLRTNWNRWRINCTRSQLKNTFCDALLDVRKIMEDNYAEYLRVFPTKCKGTPVQKTEDALLRHAYAWTPFTEAERGDGCPATANLLQNTPGYFEPCDDIVTKKNCQFVEYQRVKLAFDKLNYDLFTQAEGKKYVFNPWVKFIHGAKPYADVKNAYAYSVDDALGNVQADGTGFIIDVGGTTILENKNPAEPPINISLGFDPNIHPQFTAYRLCENTLAKEKKVNPASPTFIINANKPENCPIFLADDKTIVGQAEPRQFYMFKIIKAPPYTQNAVKWTPGPTGTAAPIDCTGNGPPFNPPFYESSRTWCCTKLAGDTGRGVWTKSQLEPGNPHNLLNHFVTTDPAKPSINDPGQTTCNQGQ